MNQKTLIKWSAKALIILLFSFLIVSNGVAQDKKSFKIGLAVLKDNEDYATGRSSFVNYIEKQSDINVEFILVDADGDLESYKEGLKGLVNIDKVDLIFTTGTRSTLPAMEVVKEVPVIFTAVAAPARSGIVKSLEQPGGNVTGTHCGVPAYPQVKAIMKVIPEAKTLGIVYTKDEPNAEIQTQDFINAASRLRLEVLTSTVSKGCNTEKEVEDATNKLIGKADVIIAHQDTSLSRYGRGMIKVAEENNIPSYVSLGQLLEQGALLSLGIDFKNLGTISGKQAVDILVNAVDPKDIAVETDNQYSLIINLSVAEKIGVTIPVQVLKSASKIIK